MIAVSVITITIIHSHDERVNILSLKLNYLLFRSIFGAIPTIGIIVYLLSREFLLTITMDSETERLFTICHCGFRVSNLHASYPLYYSVTCSGTCIAGGRWSSLKKLQHLFHQIIQ